MRCRWARVLDRFLAAVCSLADSVVLALALVVAVPFAAAAATHADVVPLLLCRSTGSHGQKFC